LRDITRVVKVVILRESNVIANMSEKDSLTPYPEINFNWSKKSYIEYCARKERIEIACLIAGVWKLEGIRKEVEKGKCYLCLG